MRTSSWCAGCARGAPKFPRLPSAAHARLVSVYRVTDLVVASTVFNGEQHPLAIVKVMAAACVTLTTRGAGIVEAVEHERTDLLLDDPADPDELLARMRGVIDNLSRRCALRRAPTR